MKALLYHILNYFFHNFDEDLKIFFVNRKKLIVFDVGCYRGLFTKSIANILKNTKIKFYLFDINKNVPQYLEKIKKVENIDYNEIAVGEKNGFAIYNYNAFFESSGSSISDLYKNDKMWIFSRKLILKLFFQSTRDYKAYKVPVVTLDSFTKRKNIKIVDVLKIDVDGSEYDLLKGSKKILKQNRIKTIIIEINEKKNFYRQK